MVEGLARFFGPLRTRPGILARAALGTPAVDDTELADTLVRRFEAELRTDGSLGAAALPTAWRVHELLDLGRAPEHPRVQRALGWLLERQGRPGAFGDGCDRVRHAHRACEHWVRGFFAPTAPGERLAPVTLPNGKAFRAEPAARFALSCLALRAALRAGRATRPEVVLHLESLRDLAAGWSDWDGYYAPDTIVAGLHALALGGPRYADVVEALVSLVLSHQRVDGLWLTADPFATVEALEATGLPDARIVVRRAVRELLERQRPDGSFGATAREERALIVLRAALWADG